MLDPFLIYFGVFFGLLGGPGRPGGILAPKSHFIKKSGKIDAPLGSVLEAKMRVKNLHLC